MNAWNAENQSNLITRDAAIAKVYEEKQNRGLNAFKVYFTDANGKREITDPSQLPDMVDYSKLTITESLDQA